MALQTRSDIETETLARAMVANNSVMFPSTRITEITKQSNQWAGSLFFWPVLTRSRYFSSKPVSQSSTPILPLPYDYYDYPTDFMTGSITRLYFNRKKYDQKAYQDFLDYVDESQDASLPPDNTKHFFATFGRQFFVWPGVTTAGTNDGMVWGNIAAPDLANSSDKTIFAQWDDAGNEAIVKKNLATLFERLDAGFAQAQLQEAVQLLTVMWNKVTAQNQKAQRLNHARFATPDYFGQQSGISTIGNFGTNIEVVS